MTLALLTPEIVKNDSQKQEQEQRFRIRDLSTEEDRLIKSVNDLRADEKAEKEQIEKGMIQFRAEAKSERERLSSEVTSLESRREEAMKPIQKVKEETDKRNEESKTKETELVSRETKLLQDEKNFREHTVETTEKLHDKSQILDEKQEDLEKREDRIKGEEARLLESSNGLAQRWVDFHKAVDAKNTELVSRESAVSAGESANKIRSAELDRLGFDYKEKDREIKHRYAILEISAAEIINKLNKTS